MNIEQFMETLELLRVMAREEPALTDEQKDELLKHPESKRAELKASFMANARQDLEKRIFGFLQALAAQIDGARLPQDVKNALHNALADVKNANFVVSPQVLEKVEEIKVKVETDSTKDAQKTTPAPDNGLTVGAALAASGIVLAVESFTERLNKKAVDFYRDKFLDELAGPLSDKAKSLPKDAPLGFTADVPQPPKRGEGKKERWAAFKEWQATEHKDGDVPPPPPAPAMSAYGRKHYELKQKQAQDLNDAIVADVQAKQTTKGVPVAEADQILKNLTAANPLKRHFAERAILAERPELEQSRKIENLELDNENAIKFLVRRERASQQKQARLMEKKMHFMKQMHKENLAQGKEVDTTALIGLQNDLNALRKETQHLGLVMDNFDAVLSKNKLTATQIMENKKPLEAIAALDVTGFKMRTARSPLKERLTQHEKPVEPVHKQNQHIKNVLMRHRKGKSVA